MSQINYLYYFFTVFTPPSRIPQKLRFDVLCTRKGNSDLVLVYVVTLCVKNHAWHKLWDYHVCKQTSTKSLDGHCDDGSNRVDMIKKLASHIRGVRSCDAVFLG